jgi:putative endonuclease
MYHAYMMSSASSVHYTGVTNNLERRVIEHKSKFNPGFSSDYNTMKLVCFEPFSDVHDAIIREKQWKTWRRSKKVALIESVNRNWRDLNEDFHR